MSEPPPEYRGTPLEWRLRSQLSLQELEGIASRPRLRSRERLAFLTNLSRRSDSDGLDLLLAYRRRMPSDMHSSYMYARALRRVVERARKRHGEQLRPRSGEFAAEALDVLATHVRTYDLPMTGDLWRPVQRTLSAVASAEIDERQSVVIERSREALARALIDDWYRLEQGRPWLGGLDSLRLGESLATARLAHSALSLIRRPERFRTALGCQAGDPTDAICFQSLAKTIFAAKYEPVLMQFVEVLSVPPDRDGLPNSLRDAWAREIANAFRLSPKLRARARETIEHLEKERRS